MKTLIKNILPLMPSNLIHCDVGACWGMDEPWYCMENKITFIRSRAYKKNDSCFVEQKNYSVIKRAIGYYRYDNAEELEILNELYLHLGCYINFF